MAEREIPDLGTQATVVCDENTHGPRCLRSYYDDEANRGLRRLYVAQREGEPAEEPALVEEFSIVSHYTLHVALYALQNPTPENIACALYLIGTSGDCEDHADHDTLLPLPVPQPPGWDRSTSPSPAPMSDPDTRHREFLDAHDERMRRVDRAIAEVRDRPLCDDCAEYADQCSCSTSPSPPQP